MSLPSPAQIAVLSGIFAVVSLSLTLGQRLGDWRSRPIAIALGIVGSAIFVCWLYLAVLWIFKVDVRALFNQQGPWFWLLMGGVSALAVTGVLARRHVRRRGSKPAVEDQHKETIDPGVTGGPSVVIEYEYEDKKPWPVPLRQTKRDAPVRVRNVSSHAAYNVTIRPLEINGLRSTFEPVIVPCIAPGDSKELRAIVLDSGPLQLHSLPDHLQRSYKDESIDELMTDKTFWLVIDFDDGSHPPKQYTTRCELKYRRWKDRVTMGRLERQLRKEAAGLAFVSWHSSDGRLPIHWPGTGDTPSWISIKNTMMAPSVTARNVTVRLEFSDSQRTKLLIVPEAVWFERSQRRTTILERWSHEVEIEGGDDQSCVLFVQSQNGDLVPYKNGGEPLGPLHYDHWTVKISVSADNVAGFEGTLGFTLARNVLAPDRPAFQRLRDLEPRLPNPAP